MKLTDFLVSEGTDEKLAELILFLGKQALDVKKGFLNTLDKSSAGETTRNMYGEEQMPLDKYADGAFISSIRE